MELKACPHCGGEAKIETKYVNCENFLVLVECVICGAQGKAYRTSTCRKDKDTEKAVKAWNMRTAKECD